MSARGMVVVESMALMRSPPGPYENDTGIPTTRATVTAMHIRAARPFHDTSLTGLSENRRCSTTPMVPASSRKTQTLMTITVGLQSK